MENVLGISLLCNHRSVNIHSVHLRLSVASESSGHHTGMCDRKIVCSATFKYQVNPISWICSTYLSCMFYIGTYTYSLNLHKWYRTIHIFLNLLFPLKCIFYDLSMLIPIGFLCLFQLWCIILFKKYWRRLSKGHDCLCDALQVDPQARPKESEAPHPCLFHGYMCYPLFPQWESLSRMQPW